MRDVLDLAAPRNPRFRSLDLWRGLACLLVVVFHSSGVAFQSLSEAGVDTGDSVGMALLAVTRIGWVGVPFFFVISGYAISATADVFRRRSHGGGTYFKRRLRRIYPPYWAMLALGAVIVFLVDVVLSPGLLTTSIAPIERPWSFTPTQWLGNLTLTESWRATAFPDMSHKDYVMGQAWTLCYEEQFYLVMGLALLVFPSRFFKVAIAVTAFSAIMPLLGLRISGFFFDGYWLAFAAGILVYWQVNYGTVRTAPVAWLVLGTGLVYAVFILPGRGVLDRDLVAAMGFAVFLLAVHRWDAPIMTSRALRPLAFAGVICYSLYLSHAVVVRSISQAMWGAGITSPLATVAITVPVSVAAATLVGWLFYLVVERRFLNRPSVAPGAAPVAVTPPDEGRRYGSCPRVRYVAACAGASAGGRPAGGWGAPRNLSRGPETSGAAVCRQRRALR